MLILAKVMLLAPFEGMIRMCYVASIPIFYLLMERNIHVAFNVNQILNATICIIDQVFILVKMNEKPYVLLAHFDWILFMQVIYVVVSLYNFLPIWIVYVLGQVYKLDATHC